jgi:hypothetical protein
MNRLICTILLILCCGSPLAAQAGVGNGQTPEPAGNDPGVESVDVEPAEDLEKADTSATEKPLGERAIGGALVGAVSGAVLSATESDCAPSRSTARAGVIGAAWGALRAALGWKPRELPLPDSGDNGGQKGPYPFDDQNCERADDH